MTAISTICAFGMCFGHRRGQPRQKTDLRGVLMGTILLIVLILLLIGALPTWPHSSGWGYYPSGGLGLIILVIVVLLLMGRL